jgi:metal-responsive CopG/Arc/MetJ family transcriptional regulator
MAQRKQKQKIRVSLSLPTELVDWIDRLTARRRGETRSGVVEQAVHSWAKRSATKDIEDATVAYYQAMTPSEHKEDEAWSRLGETSFRSEDD